MMTPIFDEIRADDSVAWADRIESAQLMPSLIRQLVAASGAKVTRCRFLTHEQTNSGGWDAEIEADSSGLFVPAGVSGWEFSKKKQDIAGKALADIEKRTSNPEGIVPGYSTFVVITLRRWPRRKLDDGTFQEPAEHKAAFEREATAKFGWKAVKILDAVELADWIAKAPAVGIWLSDVMGRRVVGARSLLAHWADLSKLRAGLTPATFLAGRQSFVQALDTWMSDSQNTAFEVRSFSHEDVRDALAAWWHLREREEDATPRAAVAVTTAEVWTYLAATPQPLLMLVDGDWEPTTEQLSAATASGHRVVTRTEAGHGRGAGCALPRLHRDSVAEELRKAGVDHTDSWRLAGEACGSGVALKRILSGQPSTPAWAKEASAADIAPVILFGAWDSRCEADRARVAEVFGCPYEEVERRLAPRADTNDPLLWRRENHWRVINREEAWRWLCARLTPEHYERFRTVAVSVLQELNPRYDLPPDERIYASIRNATPKNSHRFRRAIGEALCLLSLRPPETAAAQQARNLSRNIISGVFTNSADWRLWASLDYALVFIAEAEPELFLKAMEEDLQREKPATLELFNQRGDSFFGDNPHVEVIWSLEALMWEREWVTRAASILIRMAAKDPGGNNHPRPAGVLREAFLPWYPQCCLDVKDRCQLLDMLLAAETEVAWKLFFGLLPKVSDYSSPRHRPTFRKVEVPAGKGVPDSDYWEQVTHVARRLVESAGTDVSRWSELIEEISHLPQEVFDSVLAQVEVFGTTLEEENRAELWDTLRREAGKHRYFITAEWRMPDAAIARIEAVAAKLEPTNPVLRHAWVFTRVEAFLPGTNSETPFGQQNELRTKAQLAALREIVPSGGLPSLRALALRVGESYAGQIGFHVAKEGLWNRDSEILPSWLEDESPALNVFARGFAHARFSDGSWQWFQQVGGDSWATKTFASFSRVLPFGQATWAELEKFGSDLVDAYWGEVSPWLHERSESEAAHAVQELIRCGRPFAALECVSGCGYHKVPVSAETLLSVFGAIRAFLERLASDGPSQRPKQQLDAHKLAAVLRALQDCETLTPEQMERLEGVEWFFLPALEHHGSPRTLLGRMRREPEFFIEVLEHGGYRMDEPRDEDDELATDSEANFARMCRQLVDAAHILPGTQSDRKLDESEFLKWVAEVRTLAAKKGYSRVCDLIIGQWLLYSPVDAAGVWPCAVICRFISDFGTERLNDGFTMAIYNNQGWPGPLRNKLRVSQTNERSEAVAKLKEFAAKLDLTFPKVAALLREAASEQEQVLSQFRRDDD